MPLKLNWSTQFDQFEKFAHFRLREVFRKEISTALHNEKALPQGYSSHSLIIFEEDDPIAPNGNTKCRSMPTITPLMKKSENSINIRSLIDRDQQPLDCFCTSGVVDPDLGYL